MDDIAITGLNVPENTQGYITDLSFIDSFECKLIIVFGK